MHSYTVTRQVPDKEELWDMLKDCVSEFFGAFYEVDTADKLFDCLSTKTDFPIFGYVDGKLATCTYLVAPIYGHKASIHCFSHPNYRTPEYSKELYSRSFDLYFSLGDFIKLEGFVPEYNRAARLNCLRLGGKYTGRLESEFYFDNKWWDSLIYTLKREDFYERFRLW